MQPGENKLRVCAWSTYSGYIYAEINLYSFVKYLTDEKKLSKTENYMPKLTMLEQVYSYDLEDIKEAVRNEIERLQKHLAYLEYSMIISDTAYNNFKKAMTDALATLAAETARDESRTLYYMIKDTVMGQPY
jgi:hypothetical protein